MGIVRRSALAEQDYRDIWRYVAADKPRAADRLLQRFDAKLALYADHPAMGTSRSHLGRGLRSFPVGNYLVFYRIVPEGIELVRVLHGARQFKRSLLNP